MKKTTLWIVALLAVATLAGCNLNKTPVENPDENVEIANPASVYCEENGGTLRLEEGAWLCMFEDGSYCEEWAYQRWECQPGDIFYNRVSGDVIEENDSDEEDKYAVDYWESNDYSLEELSSAVKTIMNTVNNEWNVKVDMKEIRYLWDGKANSELNYCKELDSTIDECVVFNCDFYIPEQDAVMAWAFEPDTTLTNYEWYLGRANWGEWKVLTMGY